MRRRWVVLLAGLVAVVLMVVGWGVVQEKLAMKRGADAYLVGYPLVTMTATRDALGAPTNTFTHARFLPDGTDGVGVVAPNRDTYYSSAWLDLSEGPVLIEQPDMGDTFWLMPVLDAWTDVVADPGTRTLGNRAHSLMIAGPHWTGHSPEGVQFYRSSTDLAWAILRIAANDEIARQQDGFRIRSVAGATRPVVVTEPRRTADVRQVVDALTTDEFFTEVAQDLTVTAIPEDARSILARTGVRPGSFTSPTGRAARGMAEVPARVQQGMTEGFQSGEGATVINGWRVPPMILGAYGREYAMRAVVAREGLGANLPADTVYASTTVDADGAVLEGGRAYAIEMPANVPVRAFWSVALYDEDGAFLPGGRSGLSVSGTGDGPAATIHISPQRRTGLWLRSPQGGRFRLLMRLYWPQQQVLDNQWPYPPVRAR